MRVLIAEGREPTRSALKLLLQEEPGVHVTGEAADGDELLAALAADHSDVVLLDWELPGPAMVDLLPALRALNDQLSVVIFSGRPELRPKVLAAGADAFVSMCDPPQRLVATLQAIHEKSSPES
jgi:DNA-binding NarL/FixJ family response regulator